VAAVAALLDALLAPSADGVGEVYQWLKTILGTTALQQVKSFVLCRIEASILPPASTDDGT
jgi:hypothetical protein